MPIQRKTIIIILNYKYQPKIYARGINWTSNIAASCNKIFFTEKYDKKNQVSNQNHWTLFSQQWQKWWNIYWVYYLPLLFHICIFHKIKRHIDLFLFLKICSGDCYNLYYVCIFLLLFVETKGNEFGFHVTGAFFARVPMRHNYEYSS